MAFVPAGLCRFAFLLSGLGLASLPSSVQGLLFGLGVRVLSLRILFGLILSTSDITVASGGSIRDTMS